MQRCYQKFICKVKQNFRESTLGNTFIVHDDTKKDKFHSNGALRRSNKPGRPKTLDGKIDYKKLDLTRMVELHIEGLEGTAYTLIAYSKALKQKVRLVIWIMPNGKLISHTGKELFGWAA